MQVLYNKDCISDQAIIYWYQKGSKPQGKQHFLKATEALVKVRPLIPLLLFHSPNSFHSFPSSSRSKRTATRRKSSADGLSN